MQGFNKRMKFAVIPSECDLTGWMGVRGSITRRGIYAIDYEIDPSILRMFRMTQNKFTETESSRNEIAGFKPNSETIKV
jgi:hypothetical protein